MQSCTIDVIGIILEVGPTTMLNMKDGSQREKRTLTIGDEGNVSIGLTLWGNTCEAHDYQMGQICAFKSCRVSEYQGKSLNASSDTCDILFNVKHPRFLDLQKYQKGTTASKMKQEMRSLGTGDMGGAPSNTPTLLIEELTKFCSEDSEVLSGKPFYANLHCDIAWIFTPQDPTRNMFYLACPTCKKKVTDDGQGYRCENCNKVYEDAVPTYNFSYKVSDCSGTMTLQCLGEAGDKVLGIDCKTLYNIHQELE